MRTGGALLLIAILAVTSCRMHDDRTILIHVPDMKNAACERLISNTLSRTTGVISNQTVCTRIISENRVVIVPFDSMQTSVKNLEFAIADLGFDANKVPANQEARKKLAPEYLQDNAGAVPGDAQKAGRPAGEVAPGQ